MHPLRRSKVFRITLEGVAEGVHSLAELAVGRMCLNEGLPMPDRQVRRRDALGRLRFTDAQWRLPDGRSVVLEVDGAFHMEVSHWEADIARERDLVTTGVVVLRCTDREVNEEPGRIAASLRAVGVGRSSARASRLSDLQADDRIDSASRPPERHF
jgi:very-short-patch-repair endonuclease